MEEFHVHCKEILSIETLLYSNFRGFTFFDINVRLEVKTLVRIILIFLFFLCNVEKIFHEHFGYAS